MKNLAIALFLMVLAQTIQAQTTTLTGCFGLQFGCSKQDVKEMMKTKYPDAELLKDDIRTIGFTGGKWAGRDAYIWIFAFNSQGQLHTASVSVKPNNESGIWQLYEDISSDLVQKYGNEKYSNENWLYPYSSSDKYTYGTTALKLGKATIDKVWVFANETEDDDDDNAIQIKITNGIYVSVKYQDGRLINDVVRENTEKRKNDM